MGRRDRSAAEGREVGVTLAQYKAQFRREHPNLRVNGWDERDYQLWSQVTNLSSYGLVAGDARNPMISRADVIALLRSNAEARFENEWKRRFGENKGGE